jgi:hypothetical protein
MMALSRVTASLALASPSQHLAFARLPVNLVVSHPATVVATDLWSEFAVLQARPHEIWARFMASSMKDDLRYTPSDCFETFPFPAAYERNPALLETGQACYEFRAELMVRNNEGMTKTYNRFHRRDEYSPDILRLRELHDAMDRAVLDAYGWHDIQPVCDFFPEFDDEEDDEAESGHRGRRRYRYRWPDDIHDEVLARLLALNRERSGKTAPPEAMPPATPRKATKQKKRANREDQPTLY